MINNNKIMKYNNKIMKYITNNIIKKYEINIL